MLSSINGVRILLNFQACPSLGTKWLRRVFGFSAIKEGGKGFIIIIIIIFLFLGKFGFQGILILSSVGSLEVDGSVDEIGESPTGT